MRFSLFIAAMILCASANAEPPDLSTPKAAARSVYEAMDRGDEAALAEIFLADDADQRQLASAYAHLIVEAKRLADSAKKKYPGSSDALAQGIVSAEDLASLQDAAVQEKGDVAKLKLPGQGKEMEFRRSEGRWRLVIADFTSLPKEKLAEQIPLVNELAKAISDTTEEIASDKFPTAQEAEAAIQARVNAILAKAQKIAPTTTTAPSTQP